MEKKRNTGTSLLVLLVFVLFALCLLLVLLTGAGVYRELVRRGEEGFARRTAVQYIATRVRQTGTVTVQDFGGCQALVFPEAGEEETYLTRVYRYEGWLMELYCAEGADLSPEDGEQLLETEPLRFSLENGLLTVSGGGQTLYLHLREEAGP